MYYPHLIVNKTMIKSVTIFLSLVLSLCLTNSLDAQTTFYRGADLSFAQQLENNGAVFKDNGTQQDILDIFKNHGVNIIRLRLWYDPQNGYNDLFQTLAMARRIKTKGLKLLLDIHYSDTWADAGHQTKPAAWQNLSYTVLKDSVYQYTRRVIQALKSQNTLPSIVQIGNEVTSGMLWDTGRVGGSFDNSSQWAQFAGLLNVGIKGVKDVEPKPDTVKIMIHIDRGGDFAGAKWFFDNLYTQGVTYDIIGLSYYPWWHGSLTDLTNTLDQLEARYHKPILIAETAYPWTLNYDDNVGNIVGQSNPLLPGYPATVDGQKSYLNKVFDIVHNVPDSLGIGVVYWEPDYISVPGVGSSWENLAMFDFQGNALASMSAFEPRDATPIEQNPTVRKFSLGQNYPNPFNPTTVIPYDLAKPSHVRLTVYNILGEVVATLVSSEQPAGSYKSRFIANNIPSGVYLYKLQIDNRSFVKKMMLVK